MRVLGASAATTHDIGSAVCRDDVISINELVLAMKRLQKLPDETRLQKIAQVLDEDQDGHIKISHVLRVCMPILISVMSYSIDGKKIVIHLKV